MLTKMSKKDPIRLKFDTSSDNLACFIKKRTKLTAEHDTNHDKHSKSTRKRTKSNKEKALKFKNGDFLESILVKTFTQEFACTEDIKKLVNNLELSSEEDHSPQPKISSRAEYGSTSKKKNDYFVQEEDYKVLISDWVENPKDQIAVTSTRVGTEQTPERSSNHPQTNFSESSFSQQLGLPFQACESMQFAHFYDQNYLYQQVTSKQSSERKKRNVSNEQAKEYSIQPQKIELDGRTTLMIRNIPNKYTQELLLQEFNKNFKVKFDFFYLPIDYNNACNVGYAFINFIHAKFIYAFYNQFNGKRWSRFNSEKICSLTYARIQGTGALRNHFKNSHVMQQKVSARITQDKRYRPMLNELDEEQRFCLSKIVQGQQQKI